MDLNLLSKGPAYYSFPPELGKAIHKVTDSAVGHPLHPFQDRFLIT